jgi:signal peptidase I
MRHRYSMDWYLRLLVGRSPRRTLVRAAIVAAVAFVVFRYFLIPIHLAGGSMEPAYMDGSVNIVNTFSYRFRPPKRGDVVAIRMAGTRVMLFKRIVGLPAERIGFRNGALLVNGRELPEPYVVYREKWNMPEVTVGAGEYFVVGDNRGTDISGHALGRVDKRRIVGGPLF